MVQGAKRNPMFYVYVILSEKDKRLYTGFTADLRERLKKHNQGANPSTKFRRPFHLIFYEAYLNKTDAQRRERYLKTTKGRATLRLMLKSYFSQTKW
jgi:putative endonuclease